MSPFKRNVVLAVGVLAIFGVTVAVLTHLMPGPHKEMDYLVIEDFILAKGAQPHSNQDDSWKHEFALD